MDSHYVFVRIRSVRKDRNEYKLNHFIMQQQQTHQQQQYLINHPHHNLHQHQNYTISFLYDISIHCSIFFQY